MKTNRKLFVATTIITLCLSLFIGLIYLPVTTATNIFSDDFEDGDFSQWTSSSASTNSTSEVQSSIKHHGTYGMHTSIISQDGSDNAYCYKDFTAQNTTYLRFYWMIGDLPASNNDRDVFAWFEGGGTWEVKARYDRDSDNNRFLLEWGDGVGNGAWQTAISADTWYCIEIAFSRSATGFAKMWVDGTLRIDSGEVDLSGRNSISRVGLRQDEFYGNNWACESWFDCVVVADTYIGLEAETVEYDINAYTVGEWDNSTYFYYNGSTFQTDSEYASVILNAAMVDVNAIGGGTLTVCNGTLVLNASIVPKANVYLNLSSSVVISQNTPSELGDSISLFCSSASVAVNNFWLNGNGGAVLDGNKSSLSDHRGTDSWSSNFYDYFGFAIYSDTTSSNVTIKNVIIQNVIGQGLSLRTCQDSLVDNVTAINCGDNPITLEAAESGTFQSNSIIQNCNVTYGQDVGINTFWCHNTTIQNNHVSKVLNYTGASHWGIAAEWSENVIIKGNTVSQCEYNIVSDGSDDCIIRDNTITGVEGTGDNVGVQIKTTDNNEVINNTITDCSYPFSTWANHQTLEFSFVNNTVSGGRIVVGGSNGLLQGGTVYSTDGDGCISIRTALNTTIDNITFSGSKGVLDYGQQSNNTYIKNCNFTALTDTKLSMSNSYNTTFQANNGLTGYNHLNVTSLNGVVSESYGNQGLSSISGDLWQFPADGNITLTATANENYTFSSWTQDGENKTSNPLNFLLSADSTVTANYVEESESTLVAVRYGIHIYTGCKVDGITVSVGAKINGVG